MTATLRIEDDRVWVGTRRLAASARVFVIDQVSEPFDDGRRWVLHVRGFTLPFENGWTVQVKWGNSQALPPRTAYEPPPEEAEHATTLVVTDRDGRVVVWDDAGRAVGKSLDHSGQREHVPAADVLLTIDDVATWPTDHLEILDRV
ncbi:MAG TPA: hypothetical protein VNB24_08180 [Acidimicrobiales bacterium]|nr:hypothetical protein [Acidimicrobiales bacterium]